MKVAILNNCVPFIAGGAEHLAQALRRKLCEHGHEAMLIRIPFQWNPSEKILDHVLACRLIKLHGVDRVIGLKFPAYYVPHDNKVLWMLHQFRQAYDLWGTAYQGIPDTPEGLRIRETIINADNQYLTEAKRIYTNSAVTGERLKKFNGFHSEVLFPPLERSEHFFCAEYGDYMFYPSRVTGGKRQALVVESMRHVKSAVRLVIAGQPETPADQVTIDNLIRKFQLESRVQFIPRFISEDDKAKLFSASLGCTYVPYDEDSYGYVTLEAFHSRKPVVTCSDSGGVRLLVRNEDTGLVADPNPESLAMAFDHLHENRAEARRLGNAGYELMMSLGINWRTVIERLTS
jgi:glycosyltransferase involved in cell wall biosynthesis